MDGLDGFGVIFWHILHMITGGNTFQGPRTFQDRWYRQTLLFTNPVEFMNPGRVFQAKLRRCTIIRRPKGTLTDVFGPGRGRRAGYGHVIQPHPGIAPDPAGIWLTKLLRLVELEDEG